MSEIRAELQQVLAELTKVAPGLTHIHAQIEGILRELETRPCVGFDSRKTFTIGPGSYVIGAGGAGGNREMEVPIYNPEFAAGVTLPTNAKRIQDAEDAESDKIERAKAWAEEHDGEPYIYGSDDTDEEDESGDATDAA